MQRKKTNGEKICALTAYDTSMAQLLSDCDIDFILVGDSVGMVVCGYPDTVPVTLDIILYHLQNVKRAPIHSLVVADMPFATYSDTKTAWKNAARLMQAGAQMVKMEGGANLADTVGYLSERGIPVCAHIGLSSQMVHHMGGYKIQGREQADAERIFNDAKTLEQAGAQLCLLECIPLELAKKISTQLVIPTIGIGAGPHCDGQILVTYDLLGLTPHKPYKFVKNFLTGQTGGIHAAINAFVSEVRQGDFPTMANSFQ